MRIRRHAYNTHARAHTCTCTYAHTHTHAHRDPGRPPGNQHPPEAAACTEIRRWGHRDGEAQEPQGNGLAVESVPPTAEPQASLERRADVNELAGHETGRRGDPSCAALRGGERSGCPLEGGEAWEGETRVTWRFRKVTPVSQPAPRKRSGSGRAFLLAWPAEEAGLLPGPVCGVWDGLGPRKRLLLRHAWSLLRGLSAVCADPTSATSITHVAKE